jgi:hypothetical protein
MWKLFVAIQDKHGLVGRTNLKRCPRTRHAGELLPADPVEETRAFAYGAGAYAKLEEGETLLQIEGFAHASFPLAAEAGTMVDGIRAQAHGLTR